jgi:predicted ATPase
MFQAPGYETERLLYESATALVYRAFRTADRLPVILKILKDSHPKPELIARFKREYVLLRDLKVPGVIAVLDFVWMADHWVIVEEDFGGSSLMHLKLAGQIGIAPFLDLAIALSAVLSSIHARRVIHKDLNPSNIVLNPETGVVKVIDFGISASQLEEESIAFEPPSLLQGTPFYLSPEQTGRISRPLDYRTDFYSLGCTFYQLLTGRLPFASEDILELVYCHLARTPQSPRALRPEIPDSLAAIVLKLMAKNPDDRYQSAHGLLVDLSLCQRQLREGEPPRAAFELGRQDVASRFHLPARLYGRDAEIARLLTAFERTRQAHTGLMLVTGYSGIGKSAVVRELYAPITASRGMFACGKFEQYDRSLPYAPFVDAFQSLLQQLLSEGEEQVLAWREQFLREMGPSCAVLMDLIPQFELITGPLPPAALLPPSETNLRFLRAMRAFVRAFARAEHPLVLFLDDLQWSDAASMELLRNLTAVDPVAYLFIVGAYRDNEVGPGHPLSLVLKDIELAEYLHLGPLRPSDVARMLTDALRTPDEKSTQLAALVHARTGGNPFFIGEFLKALHADEHIHFNHQAGAWDWDIERVRARDISTNVAELLMGKLSRLAPATQALLQWAACIGNRFDLHTLLVITGRPANDIIAELLAAIADGFVLPMTSDYRLFEADVEHLEDRIEVEYKFAHDRLQQAAYLSIPDADRKPMHLRIGRQLARDPGRWEVLKIVSQLNLAGELVTDPAERLAIARLNLQAGEKAKWAAANQSAFKFFVAGLSFLLPVGSVTTESADVLDPGAAAFATDYDLSLSLTGRAAESAYLLADFPSMDRLADSALENARSWQDKVEIYQVRINALTAQNRLLDAIQAAREILEPLGVRLPLKPGQAEVDEALREVDQALQGRSFASLLAIPQAPAGAAHHGVLRILDSIHATTAMTLQSLGPIVAAKMVQLTIMHGRTEASISGYVYLGIQLCGQGRIEEGYQLAQLARRACAEQARSAQVAELSSNGYYFIFHWKEPLRALVEDIKTGYQAAWDAGQVALAANCLINTTVAPFIAGSELKALAERMREVVTIVEQLKQGPYALWLRLYRQCALNLIASSVDPTLLRGEAYDEELSMPVLRRNQDDITIQLLHILKVMLCYRYDQPRAAVTYYRQYVDGKYPRSGLLLPATMMYYCLGLLAIYNEEAPDQRDSLCDEVRARLCQLREWADHGPMNYGHKYHLVEAELARVLGQYSKAREHYDLAIDLAHTNQYFNEESLALERAALFYREQGRARLAGYYMRDALYAYQRWGAEARATQLRERYPELLAASHPWGASRAGGQTLSAAKDGGTLATGELPDFDLLTLLRAARAISVEHEPAGLLRQVMSLCLKYAGAHSGFLILARRDELIVKARGTLKEEAQVEVISELLADQEGLATGIVHYVARTEEPVVLEHAAEEGPFKNDPYIRRSACKSVLCLPIIYQGVLVALAYMENNNTVGAFDAERLEILRLLLAQAAVSIENSLLRNLNQDAEFHYSVGGSLAANTPSYVVRQADRTLIETIRQGELCYVFNARQMGKSSLRVHAMDQLQQGGFRCAAVDLTAIGAGTLTAEQWYAGVARAILSGLELTREVNLRTFWRERSFLSPAQRLGELLEEEVLTRVSDPIVIFVDEIDMALGCEFSLDDFFALIRSLYNKRADHPRYRRLCFVFLGVATPTELIVDRTRTPFNIGQAVPMGGFRFTEARILARGLSGFAQPEQLLKSILNWTDGQPFLTQKLCQLARVAESRPAPDREREWVATLVRQRVVDKWRVHDEPEHLKTVEARILRSPRRSALLELYSEILDQAGVAARDTPLESELVLSGLVVPHWGKLRPGNLIYASVFDNDWIRQASG